MPLQLPERQFAGRPKRALMEGGNVANRRQPTLQSSFLEGIRCRCRRLEVGEDGISSCTRKEALRPMLAGHSLHDPVNCVLKCADSGRGCMGRKREAEGGLFQGEIRDMKWYAQQPCDLNCVLLFVGTGHWRQQRATDNTCARITKACPNDRRIQAA